MRETTTKEPLTMEQRALVSEHLHLAQLCAKRRYNPCMSPEDRLQYAYLGLIDAARNYRPEEGDFGPYANYRIWGAIKDGERASTGVIRVKRKDLASGAKTPRIVQQSILAGGDPAEDGISEYVVPTPLPTHETRDAIDAAMTVLPERERRIVRRYWMDGLTIKQVSAEVGVSESRISQMMPDALDRLRNHSALADYARGV